MNQSKRCVEYALEGLPTQDMLVQMERAADATEVERFAANAIRHQEGIVNRSGPSMRTIIGNFPEISTIFIIIS